MQGEDMADDTAAVTEDRHVREPTPTQLMTDADAAGITKYFLGLQFPKAIGKQKMTIGWFPPQVHESAKGNLPWVKNFKDLPDQVASKIIDFVGMKSARYLNPDSPSDQEEYLEAKAALDSCAALGKPELRDQFWAQNIIFDGMNGADGGFSTPEDIAPLVQNLHVLIELDSDLTPLPSIVAQQQQDAYDFGMPFARLDGRDTEVDSISSYFPNAKHICVQFNFSKENVDRLPDNNKIRGNIDNLRARLKQIVVKLLHINMINMPHLEVVLTDTDIDMVDIITAPIDVKALNAVNVAYRMISAKGQRFYIGETDTVMPVDTSGSDE